MDGFSFEGWSSPVEVLYRLRVMRFPAGTFGQFEVNKVILHDWVARKCGDCAKTIREGQTFSCHHHMSEKDLEFLGVSPEEIRKL